MEIKEYVEKNVLYAAGMNNSYVNIQGVTEIKNTDD